MPNELQEKWSEAIVEELLFNNAEQNDSFLSLVLNLDGTIEIMNDSGNSDPEIYSAHYHSLAEITRALEAHQQPKDLSTHRPTPVNALNNFNRAESLNLLSQATMTNTIVGFHAALGALTYRCIRFATSLRILIVNRYGPALRKLLNEITNWIRAHPYKSASILSGISLFTLALAAPAILGAVGFSAIGPVASSIAAAWQASIGLVASGSVFAFLQSVAMGGAAMGFIWVIGAFGGMVVVGVGLDSLKGTICGLTDNAKEAIGGLTDNAKEAIGGLTKNAKGAIGGLTDNAKEAIGGLTDNAKEAIGGLTENAKGAIGGFTENAKGAIGGFTENAKGAIGGFMGNVKGFFGKKED